MLYLYSTRTLGLPQKLHMLSLYLPFTNEQMGALFSWGWMNGFTLTMWNGNVYRNIFSK